MTADAFSQLIILYDWFLLVGLLVFLMLIARFYQRFSGEKTHFRLYLIPMLLFGAEAVRQSNFAHDSLGNWLAAGAGLLLLTLSLFLYRRMTAGGAEMDISALLGLLGPLSVAIALVVIGLLSRRLGEQTQAKPYYLGFYAAAALIGISIAAQLLDLLFHFAHGESDLGWVLIMDGLPALAVTIGVIFAWRYWSWLLAERD